jgi:LysR family pca operon transcriptional activator
MTPPAVTKSLRELETYLQSDLFERTSKGMVLTHSGETFLSYASRALNEIEQGELEVERLTQGDGGRVSIGATVETGVLVLPKAIGDLIAKRPNMDVSLTGGRYEELSQGVRTGALDFFLGMAPDQESTKDLEFTPMYLDHLHLVARVGHPLFEKAEVTLDDVLKYRWLLTSNEGQLAKLVRSSLEVEGASLPENPLVVEPISFFRGTAQSTDLIAVVSGARLIAELELKQLKELPVSLPETKHIVGIVERNDPYRSSFAKELIHLIQKWAQELGLPINQAKQPPRLPKVMKN